MDKPKICIDCKHHTIICEMHVYVHPGAVDVVTGQPMNLPCNSQRSDTHSFAVCRHEGKLWEKKEKEEEGMKEKPVFKNMFCPDCGEPIEDEPLIQVGKYDKDFRPIFAHEFHTIK